MESPKHEDELLDATEAAAVLEVTEDRIPVLVEQGLLIPVDDSPRARFLRSDVAAVRLQGG